MSIEPTQEIVKGDDSREIKCCLQEIMSKKHTIPMKVYDKQIQDIGDESQYAVPRVTTPSNYWTWLLVGQKGSGKSNVILSVLDNKLKHLYDNIFMISPTAKLDKKYHKLVEELQVDKHFYERYSDALVGEIMERIEKFLNEHKADHPRSLMIFDDCIADLPKAQVKSANFNRLMTCSRHLKCDLILTSQVYKLLNTTVRKNFNIITMWPSVNKSERAAYLEEINVDEDLLYTLLDYTARKRFGNLTVNFMNLHDIRFFQNFIPLRIKECSP